MWWIKLGFVDLNNITVTSLAESFFPKQFEHYQWVILLLLGFRKGKQGGASKYLLIIMMYAEWSSKKISIVCLLNRRMRLRPARCGAFAQDTSSLHSL